jgi:hypothetical protein
LNYCVAATTLWIDSRLGAIMAPVLTLRNVSVGEGQSVFASSLILSTFDQYTVTDYAFWDGGAGGGFFTYNGVVQPAGQWIYVTPGNLGLLKYVGGSTAASETLYVDAYDVSGWGPVQSLTATTTAPSGTPTYAQKDATGATDYFDHKGGTIIQIDTGGSVSWRNNNPGNITYVGQSSAIGSYYDSAANHVFAIFPSYSAGVQAAI